MIVECPRCETKYNLDESKISPEGSSVRCSRCKHVFTAAPPQEESVVAEPEAEETEPAAEEMEEAPVEEGLSEEPFVEEQEVSEEVPGEVPEQGEEFDEEDLGFDLDVKPKKASRVSLLIFILALAALAAGGYYLFLYFKPQITGQSEQLKKDAISQRELSTSELGVYVPLINVRQYTEENEKIGALLVIEGQAVNGFDTVKELIMLEAQLIDSQGNVLESRQFLCGNTVNLFELQVLSREELESALNARVNVLKYNTNLQPGDEVPFMVVFYNPPEEVEEFVVKVIDIKDPEQ